MSTTRPLTLDEFLELPDAEPALEFVEGEVSQNMSPKGHLSALRADFLGAFNRYDRAARLARAFREPRAAGSIAQDVFAAPGSDR